MIEVKKERKKHSKYSKYSKRERVSEIIFLFSVSEMETTLAEKQSEWLSQKDILEDKVKRLEVRIENLEFPVTFFFFFF